MSYHLVQWGTEYHPFLCGKGHKTRHHCWNERMHEWLLYFCWDISVHCEAWCSKSSNWWHNTINLVVQKCRSNGTRAWRLHGLSVWQTQEKWGTGVQLLFEESLEGHPNHKGCMTVSPGSQKSWKSKWTKVFTLHVGNFIWRKKTLPGKAQHTDNLCT